MYVCTLGVVKNNNKKWPLELSNTCVKFVVVVCNVFTYMFTHNGKRTQLDVHS